MYYASGDPFSEGPTPVGFYDGRLHPNPPFQTTNSPSIYGAYDMAGNAWEWVADWYSASYYASAPSTNPLGPVTGTFRGLRGGAWNIATSYLPCARRYYNGPPTLRYEYNGFRCARTGP